jgi:hypothetical protein
MTRNSDPGLKHRPPSVLKGYKPEYVRYMWVVYTENETYHSGFTQMGIINLQTRGAEKIKELRVIDLVKNRVYPVDVDKVEKFLKDWGDNYFNPNWSVKGSRYL